MQAQFGSAEAPTTISCEPFYGAGEMIVAGLKKSEVEDLLEKHKDHLPSQCNAKEALKKTG